MYTILDGKFVNDRSFQNKSMNRALVGYRPYVLETGDLKLEKPNIYQRIVDVPNEDFCIDYVITKKGTLSKDAQVFVVVEAEGKSVIEVNENTTYLAVARWISCVFLLLVFVVYILLPELRNLGGLILMNYVASLFIAFLLLAVIQLDVYHTGTCIGLTCAIYYFFLATFCWMSVMSYDIWWTFRGYAKARPIHRRGERFKLQMYCLCAYGLPLLLTIFLYVVIVTNMQHIPWFITPHLLDTGCFLEGEAKMLYLYTPMLILIICNWLFYLMTAFNVWRLSRGTAVLDTAAAGSPAAHRCQMRRFMVYLKLSVVMGLSWLLEIISFIHPRYGMWYLSDTYNMLLGLVIFVIFVCKKKIYKKLYKRCRMKPTRSFHQGSSNSYFSNSSDSGPETVTLQVCGNPKGQNGFSNSK
ncbi:unnamed protein product [Arctia plantaginis]|uniref:G-protein coupled receptors family 2 profile 2 domain-containing protein n=1 Tax=Arctia plantaginis TaxID=874455 RepID=A0A8S0Z9U0_ARCPL|nr:unnamed protein product [Arctia plantaginis]